MPSERAISFIDWPRAGLRVSEVVKLKVKHIDSALGVIRVEQSKGKKDRHSWVDLIINGI
jgi:site-specific recombinase XerC